MRPLPPPRFGAAGWERVGFALLLAATPPGLATDYNERRGQLWGRCQSQRTLPTPDEFEAETRALRDLLRVAAAPRGVSLDGPARQELIRAARCLDAAEQAGAEAGAD